MEVALWRKYGWKVRMAFFVITFDFSFVFCAIYIFFSPFISFPPSRLIISPYRNCRFRNYNNCVTKPYNFSENCWWKHRRWLGTFSTIGEAVWKCEFFQVFSRWKGILILSLIRSNKFSLPAIEVMAVTPFFSQLSRILAPNLNFFKMRNITEANVLLVEFINFSVSYNVGKIIHCDLLEFSTDYFRIFLPKSDDPSLHR